MLDTFVATMYINMKITIDASSNILYSSYYLLGLQRLFGNKIKFSAKPFQELRFSVNRMAFIVKNNEQTKKIVIDFNNYPDLDEEALDWCDVYGKVNLASESTIHPKIRSIGPLTAVRLFNKPQALWYALSNLMRARHKVEKRKLFLSYYKGMLKRPEWSDYELSTPKANYVFFASSLWKKEPEANQYRANFIEVCKAHKSINFEGGFAPRALLDISGFEHLKMTKRVDMNDFLAKNSASCLTFNTPTVGGCNGWRLAENLMMGKVIISTPLIRELPVPLQDKVNVLFVDGSQKSIQEAIDLVLSDDELQQSMAEKRQKIFL